MPDREPVAGHSARLLRGLIWTGVSLAPLAAAIVLLGGSVGSVRFAVLLMAVSVVLIGASVLIRNDPALQRMDVEDRVAEEVAVLRRELRAEFGQPGPGLAPSEPAYFRDQGVPQDDPFPTGPAPEPAFGGGGRASVPVAAAAMPMRPAPAPGPAPRSPGMPPRREPGMVPGGQPVGAAVPMGAAAPMNATAPMGAVAAAPPPRQRGAASVPPPAPPAAPPARASAAVRPASTEYGRSEPTGGEDYDDFGGEPSGEVYGTTYGSGTTYGGPGDYGHEGYYEESGDVYEGGYAEPDGYGIAGGYDGAAKQVSGDPNYRAKRHRPSANDTNVGSLEDFAEYGGYNSYLQPRSEERPGRW